MMHRVVVVYTLRNLDSVHPSHLGTIVRVIVSVVERVIVPRQLWCPLDRVVT